MNILHPILHQKIANLVQGFSVEVWPTDIQTSKNWAKWLPKATPVYIAQIEEDRAEQVLASGDYIAATARILKKYDGLWFKDESFVVSKL